MSDINEQKIPLRVFLTWVTKELPEPLKSRIRALKKNNPEFKYHLYDDRDCRAFIQKYYSKNVLDAYDKLIPGAYQADLWRCCVLYMYGGIYMDIKITTLPNVKLINLINKEHFVADRPPNSIYNAFMICKPQNILLKHTISAIIKNVRTEFYGDNPLAPTGPILMGGLAKRLGIQTTMAHLNSGGFIIQGNIKILSNIFPEYDKIRQSAYQKKQTNRYHILWNNRQIYRQ